MWLIVGVVALVVVWASETYLGLASYYRTEWNMGPSFRGDALARGWIRWDASWYAGIARDGYFYRIDEQSSVAFFPLYPMLMRALGAFSLDTYVAGMLITLAAGLATVLMFSRWCREHLSAAEAWTALLCLVLYPYAFYLFGVVYADTLFVALALAAFVALERRRPVLAGCFGLLAALTRPVGIALLLGLVVLVLEQRGVIGRDADRSSPLRTRFGRLRPADAGVLLTGVGLLGYMVYLWRSFGNPMAFASTQSAPGWNLDPGPATWFKVRVWELMTGAVTEPPGYLQGALLQGAIGFACLATVPTIIRRFGWGYGVYVTVAIAFSLLQLKDFHGLGRHAPAAFPAFAVFGVWLSERPVLRTAALALSGVLLLLFTSLYARGYYLT